MRRSIHITQRMRFRILVSGALVIAAALLNRSSVIFFLSGGGSPAYVFPGLLFPLLISLLWGAPLGAAACVLSLWPALWRIYAHQPSFALILGVFYLLWVIWHGVRRAARRRSDSIRMYALFLDEILFRVPAEVMFFLLIFRTPLSTYYGMDPSADVAIITHIVSSSLMVFVVHVLLLIPKVKQWFRIEDADLKFRAHDIYLHVFLFGVFIWFFDPLLFGGYDTVSQMLDHQLDFASHTVLIVYMVILTASAAALGYIQEQRNLQENLNARTNMLLKTVYAVSNALISEDTIEQLGNRLCREICSCDGFDSAWMIIDLGDGEALKVFHSGIQEGFGPFSEDIEKGDYPECIQNLKSLDDILFVHESSMICQDCRISEFCRNRFGYVVQLSQQQELLGWMGLSSSEHLVFSEADQQLLKKAAHDVTQRICELQLQSETERIHRDLQEMYALYDALYEQMPSGLVVIGDDHRIMSVNNRTCEVTGFSREELEGSPCDIICPKGSLGNECLIWEVGKKGFHGMSTTLRCKDGSKLPVLKNAARVNINGRDAILELIQDLSEQKRSSEALEKHILALSRPVTSSEGLRLSELFSLKEIQALQDRFAESTGLASIITEPDGTPITRPSGFRRICSQYVRTTEQGRSSCQLSDEILGRPDAEGPRVGICGSIGLMDSGAAITVGDVHIASWMLGQVRTEDASKDELIRFAEQTGQDPDELMEAFLEVPVSTAEAFRKSTMTLHSLTNLLSTIAYQNVQQAGILKERTDAQEERDRLAAAIEQSGEIVMITDTESRILYVNPVFEQITGFLREEVLGMAPNLLNSGKQDTAFYEGMYAALYRGDTWTGRFINRKKDGSLYEEEATISPVKVSGQIAYFVAVKRDMTESKKMFEQLLHSQKMESIGQLAGGVAHDFNNLLMGILGYIDLCKGIISPSHEAMGYLDQMQKIAFRSADLTKQLLTFARKEEIQPMYIDLNRQIDDALQLLRRLIGEDIELHWQSGEYDRRIFADPTHVDQILANVVINARDAIGGTGEIRIQTGLQARGSEIVLTVSDSGCGMTEEVKRHLFDPFFTTKASGRGTGLGLSTVHSIMQECEGRIEIDSILGQGTEFRFIFPAYDKSLILDEQRMDETAPGASGQETILVVEDEQSIRRILSSMLNKAGYRVLTAETGEAALKLLEESSEQVDMILTDLIMPGMTGKDLSEVAAASYPGITCLFMSGYTADIMSDRGMGEGKFSYLKKPFTSEQLLNFVHDAWEGRETEACREN